MSRPQWRGAYISLHHVSQRAGIAEFAGQGGGGGDGSGGGGGLVLSRTVEGLRVGRTGTGWAEEPWVELPELALPAAPAGFAVCAGG